MKQKEISLLTNIFHIQQRSAESREIANKNPTESNMLRIVIIPHKRHKFINAKIDKTKKDQHNGF